MAILMIALPLILFALIFRCANKEKKLVGFYQQINVCGRWYAFFTGDFLLAGGGALVVAPVMAVMTLLGTFKNADESFDPWETIVILLICGAILLPIGILLFNRAKKKCPAELRKRFFWDIVIMMLGTSCRVAFFFVAFIYKAMWEASKPVYYEVDGKIVHKYPGDDTVYDESGFKYGTITNDGKAVIKS